MLFKVYLGASAPWMECMWHGTYNCPAPRRGDATGKEGYPTVVFNVVTSHTRRIISIAGPFDGARNDETIVRVDDIVSKVRTLELFTKYIFKLFDAFGVEVFCKGAWIMCDNMYTVDNMCTAATGRPLAGHAALHQNRNDSRRIVTTPRI